MVPVGGRGGVGPCPPRHQTQRPFWKGGEGAACLGEPQAGRDRHEGLGGCCLSLQGGHGPRRSVGEGEVSDPALREKKTTQAGPDQGGPGSKHSGVSMETQVRRQRGGVGVATVWGPPGEWR